MYENLYLTEEEFEIIDILRQSNFIITIENKGDIFVEYLILFEQIYNGESIRYLCPGFNNRIFNLNPIIKNDDNIILSSYVVGPPMNTKTDKFYNYQIINCMNSLDYKFKVPSKTITIIKF